MSAPVLPTNHFHRFHVAVHKMGPPGPIGPPGPPGSGAQTPWQGDVDAANHELNFVKKIRFHDQNIDNTNLFDHRMLAANNTIVISAGSSPTQSGFVMLMTAEQGQAPVGRLTVSAVGVAVNAPMLFANEKISIGVAESAGDYALDAFGDINISGSYKKGGVTVMLTAEEVIAAVEANPALKARLKEALA